MTKVAYVITDENNFMLESYASKKSAQERIINLESQTLHHYSIKEIPFIDIKEEDQ